MLVFKYISLHYLKYFFVILTALIFFSVGFDYVGVASQLPDSANLVLMYVVYKVFYSIDMLLPLTLIFAMIATKVSFIRNNTLVGFYSLGYSKVDILKPFVAVSTLIIIIFIALHSTSFARANEMARTIKANDSLVYTTTDLFFTYQDKYVYFAELFPLQERAKDIRIFSVKDSKLQKVVTADGAHYKDGFWHIDDAHIITKPTQLTLNMTEGVSIEEGVQLKLLKDFRPKILDQVYEGKVDFTIFDAVDAIVLLNSENISIEKIKSALYKIFIYPFFVPSLLIVIFFIVPTSTRSLSVSLFSFGAILATLMTWVFLFTMIEFSNNKVISSEVGIIAPVALLWLVAYFIWNKNRAYH
ncbi:MAG: LptF/LptG family permease [Campylobacterota bacterium]|nr:LptF/LptG family permease [Campylobacterota bacterium]